jgi:RNA polymerase sigma factor (sigma-70 family)
MDAAARLRLGRNLLRLAQGERDAFDEVFRALWPPILALARRLLDADAEAEDAAQEVLMKVFAQVDQYDAGRDALSWVFAITAFEARTFRKRRVRRREETGAAIESPDDRGRTPEVDLGDAELRARLGQSVDLLTEADRKAISAYLGDGHEQGESLPLAATDRKRRQRAIARLRSIWRSLHGFHP